MPGINAAPNKPFNRQNSTHISVGPHVFPARVSLKWLYSSPEHMSMMDVSRAPTVGALGANSRRFRRCRSYCRGSRRSHDRAAVQVKGIGNTLVHRHGLHFYQFIRIGFTGFSSFIKFSYFNRSEIDTPLRRLGPIETSNS